MPDFPSYSRDMDYARPFIDAIKNKLMGDTGFGESVPSNPRTLIPEGSSVNLRMPEGDTGFGGSVPNPMSPGSINPYGRDMNYNPIAAEAPTAASAAAAKNWASIPENISPLGQRLLAEGYVPGLEKYTYVHPNRPSISHLTWPRNHDYFTSLKEARALRHGYTDPLAKFAEEGSRGIYPALRQALRGDFTGAAGDLATYALLNSDRARAIGAKFAQSHPVLSTLGSAGARGVMGALPAYDIANNTQEMLYGKDKVDPRISVAAGLGTAAASMGLLGESAAAVLANTPLVPLAVSTYTAPHWAEMAKGYAETPTHERVNGNSIPYHGYMH